jgi:IclR family transcriptional regulator, pca regulon regulatory protein
VPRVSQASGRRKSERTQAAWTVPSLREPRYSQSLERGLAILSCFTPERPVLGIADIADELGMSRSTTHRYVITLVALGYLEQGASRKYRLGLRVTELGMSAMNATGLREHAHHYLEELRQRTSYTAAISVLEGTDALLLDRVRSHRRGHGAGVLRLQRGSRLPGHSSASGKLLIAYLPEAELRGVLSQMKLARLGPNTITSKKALREELAKIRGQGYAVDDCELAEGIAALAVPVRDESSTVVATITLAAHRSMITLAEMRQGLLPYVLAAADGVSARLGYRRAAGEQD